MDNRETFRRIFSCQPIEQIPAYFFVSWIETKRRWQQEGFEGTIDWVQAGGNVGPQLDGMGPDCSYSRFTDYITMFNEVFNRH